MTRVPTAALAISSRLDVRRYVPAGSLVALMVTTIYELLKELALPGITRWQSHALTIVYVTAGVTVLAWAWQRGAGQMRREARQLAGWGQRSEAALRAFVDARPEPAFLINRAHIIGTLNQALADRLGRSMDDVLGGGPVAVRPRRELARRPLVD